MYTISIILACSGFVFSLLAWNYENTRYENVISIIYGIFVTVISLLNILIIMD